jgi:dolichol-phosphate mannosyltransferase
MEIATGDAVVLLEGHLQDPPEMIKDFYEKWKKGYNVVYGTRIKREASWHMQILYKVFYRVFKYLSDVDIPVDAGDFSLIDRKAIEHLLRFRENDYFVRGLRAWIGFKQTGVPYSRPERMFGRSTSNFLEHLQWAKKGIFSFSMKPLIYIQGLGFMIFGSTIVLVLYYLISYFIHPPTQAPGVTTIILLLLGLSGIQIVSLSIIGDYVGKILEEAKERPRFIRARIIKGTEIISSEAAIDLLVGDRRQQVMDKNKGK